MSSKDIQSTQEQIKQQSQEQANIWRYKNEFKKIKETEAQNNITSFNKENSDQFLDQLQNDPEKFIGTFEVKDVYKVIRGYVDGQGQQLRLFTTNFTPFGVKKASICIVHGFGEHSGRFLNMADFFARKGFQVHLIDLRGFGYSGGARGAADLEKLHMDVESMLKQVSKDLPLFLYGHSLGGLIVLTLAMRNPELNVAGIISTSALIGFPKDRKMSFLKKTVVKGLGKKLEDIVVNSMIHPTALTKNNLYIRKCFGDRLMIPFLGLNMAKSILEGTDYVMPNAYKFSKPVLMVHGKLDMVTNHFDTIQFYNRCSTLDSDKKLVLFENGYHELQHDIECEQLKQECLDWMNNIIPKSKPFGITIKNMKYGVEKKPKKSLKKPILCILILIYFYYMHKFKDHPLFGKKWKFWVLSPLIYLYMRIRY